MISKKHISSLLLAASLLLSNNVFAYALHGSLERDDSVTLSDNQGHVYFGYAEDDADGTLNITVQDDRGIVYSGTATETSDGKYNLDLDNDDGHYATGVLLEK